MKKLDKDIYEENDNRKNEEKITKKKIVSKSFIAFIVVIIVIGLYFIFPPKTLRLLQSAESWSNEEYVSIYFGRFGGFKIATEAEPAAFKKMIPLNFYIYLGSKHIIVIGKDGIGRVSINSITKDSVELVYNGENFAFDAPLNDETTGDIGIDEIGCYTCNECHTFMYEDRASYYVSTLIDESHIGALKTKDKITKAQKVKDDKGKKISLDKNVKYYIMDMSTTVSQMYNLEHKCKYKELSYDEVKRMYDGTPKYAYIWLNKKNKAEIILYVNLEIKEVSDDTLSDEEIRKCSQFYDKKREIDYKNIYEISKTTK